MFLARMIENEMSDGFIICEVIGEQTPVKYIPSIHDEYFMPTQRLATQLPLEANQRAKGTPTPQHQMRSILQGRKKW